MDRWHFTLWNTQRILTDEDSVKKFALNGKDFIDLTFGDFLIVSQLYRLRIDAHGDVHGVYIDDDLKVADDFADFLWRYSNDPSSELLDLS